MTRIVEPNAVNPAITGPGRGWCFGQVFSDAASCLAARVAFFSGLREKTSYHCPL